MPVAALDHDVAGAELVVTVVEAEHDPAVDHDHEVEGVGGVHAGLVGVVALHPDPVAAALTRAGEADAPHRAATGRRFEPDGTTRFVAPVVDGRRGSVEPQPRGHAEAIGPNGALGLAVGPDHCAAVGVVAGDHPSGRELV